MVATGDWTTPQIFGHPQFEKPIFFYWMTAASFVVFGETEFAARVPAALPATLLVGLVYAFGIGFMGRRAALLSAIVLGTGLEYAIMSRLMLTDIGLALFISGALFSYWKATEDEANRTRWILLHFVFGGLAALMKGPIGTIATFLAIWSFSWIMNRPRLFRGPALWGGIALYAIIAVPWYAIMLNKFGWLFWNEFFIHENWHRLIRAEHPANNHWYYYIGLLLGGSLPWMPAVALAANRAAQGIRNDARLAFLWCWIISSVLLLTLAQSKLPSYVFYVFVPLSMAAGIALDELITHGFRSPRERKLVLGFTIFQFIAAFAAPMIKVARPFATPALAMAACFAVALVLFWRQRWTGAIVASLAATIALIGGALVFSVDHVEEYSSSRPVAQAMMKGQDGEEPLIAGKFLARGIHYYSHQPVWVLANKPQPFWTPHPLPVIAGRDALTEFVEKYGAVRVTIRRSEWPFWLKSKLVAKAGEPTWYGDNAIVRLVAPKRVTANE
jgi:4-amino-4-deoxy-L-arabinose transferase-like glycosyltransferase